MDDPNNNMLQKIRKEFKLNEVIQGTETDYEILKRLMEWTNSRWKHNGHSIPDKQDPYSILLSAKKGDSFRCVEYAIVLSAVARSYGLPSRILYLRKKNAAIEKNNAGHVVCEVW